MVIENYDCPTLGDYNRQPRSGGHESNGTIHGLSQPREWSHCIGCGQPVWRYPTMFAAWRTYLYLIEEDPV